MRRLGIVQDREAIDPVVQDRYARLFDVMLSRAHAEALAALFSWVPPNASQPSQVDALDIVS